MRETKTGGHSDTSMPEQYQKPNGYQAKESAPSGAHTSHFVPTSRRIVQFSNGKGPGPDARVVYIDGAFDLFRAGHVEILKHAKQLGDFLLVGIYSDQTVRTVSDRKYPPDGDVDPFAAPRSMGIFRMIESPRDTAAASVAKRIVANHDIYKKGNEKKGESEKRYYAEKKFVYGD